MLFERIRARIKPAKEAKVSGSLSGRSIRYILGIFLIGFSSISGLIALRAADPFMVREAREIAFDMLQRTSPRPYLDAPVKIIDINESSLEQLGQWPWPRDRLAELVDRLHTAGAVAVVFDFLFVEADRMSPSQPAQNTELQSNQSLGQQTGTAVLPNNDQIFADALRRGNVVLGFGTSAQRQELPPVKAGFAYTGQDPAPFITALQGGAGLLPVLAEAAAGIGSVNLRKDNSANAVRVVQLLWSDDGQLYPSLISEALRIAQGAKTYVVNADQVIGGVQSVRIGAFDVPTGPNGELYLYYTVPRADRYISAADVCNDNQLRALAAQLAGKIVLIGTWLYHPGR